MTWLPLRGDPTLVFVEPDRREADLKVPLVRTEENILQDGMGWDSDSGGSSTSRPSVRVS